MRHDINNEVIRNIRMHNNMCYYKYALLFFLNLSIVIMNHMCIKFSFKYYFLFIKYVKMKVIIQPLTNVKQ